MDDTQNQAVTPPVDPVPSDPTATPSPSQDDVADIKLPGEASEEPVAPTSIPPVEDKPVVPAEPAVPATPPAEPAATDKPVV